VAAYKDSTVHSARSGFADSQLKILITASEREAKTATDKRYWCKSISRQGQVGPCQWGEFGKEAERILVASKT